MPILAPLIRFEFGATLSTEEARQLAFQIFCAVEWLPADLRNVRWDRAKITSEFAAATKAGIVREATQEMQEPTYWSGALDDFLLGRHQIDHALVARLSSR